MPTVDDRSLVEMVGEALHTATIGKALGIVRRSA